MNMLPIIPFNAFAQTAPQPVNLETIKFLEGQFQSITTTFNIYVGLVSTVSALFVGFAAYFFKRTLSEAKQEVRQMVREAVQVEIAATIKRRVDMLEQILEREEVPSLVSIDYVIQNVSEPLPKECQLLKARFPRLKVRRLDSRKFMADVVVLDLVEYQPRDSSLSEAEVEEVLKKVTGRMVADSALAVYVRRRYEAINHLGQKVEYSTSANGPTQLLGNVINLAYVAHALRTEY